MASLKVIFGEEIRRRERDSTRTVREQVLEMFPVLSKQPFELKLVRDGGPITVYQVEVTEVEVAVSSKRKEEGEQKRPEVVISAKQPEKMEQAPIALTDEDLRVIVLRALENDSVKDVFRRLITDVLKSKEESAQKEKEAREAEMLRQQQAKEELAAAAALLLKRKQEEEEKEAMAAELKREQEKQAREMAEREAAKIIQGPPAPIDERAAAIQQLYDMGFTDRARSAAVFDQVGPQLDAIVARLLDM